MASLDPNQRKFEEAKILLARILEGGFQAMFAGGCVRDRILNLTPSDYDIACSGTPEEMMRLFRESTYTVIPTGIDHGTVTIVGKYAATEITSLRKDIDTDGRKAIVEFGASFEEDAKRRDFTVNAMYEDIHGQVFDFHGGRSDLTANRLRFVGDAHQRIKEDYLRQLRMIRFISKFGFQVDSETLTAIKIHVPGLRKISQERITSELRKILGGGFLKEALLSMKETGMFLEVFKGLPDPSEELCSEVSKLKSSHLSSELLFEFRLAYLLTILSREGSLETSQAASEAASEVAFFLKSLKLSSDEFKRIGGFIEFVKLPKFPTRDETMAFLDHLEDCKIPMESLDPLGAALREVSRENKWKDFADFETQHSALRKARLLITGDDLIRELNLKPGRDLGWILDGLKRSFRRGEWSTAEEAFQLARSLLESLKKN